MFDSDDESPQVSHGFCLLFGTMTSVVDAGFLRRDVYEKYKQELDVSYMRGDPQPEKVAKL